MRFVQRIMCHRLLLGFAILLAVLLAKGQSVLASGDWKKVGVVETGIYKLDRSYLASIGVPVNSVDPRTIKVYGNGGGGMLPQENAVSRPSDLIQNRIYASGTSDGSLDEGDYFLFYGRSPDRKEWSADGLIYEKNLYSDSTYYFITYGGTNGSRIQSMASETTQPTKITSYDDVIIHELEDRNLLRSGRRWFGENMSAAAGLTHTFSYTRPNVLSIDSISITAAAQSQQNCSMDISVNGTLAGNLPLESIPFGIGATYSIKGRENTETYNLAGASDNLTVTTLFNPQGSTSIGYLDHFELFLTRGLTVSNNLTFFRSRQSTENPISTYQIGGMSAQAQIWDVSDAVNPTQMNFVLNGQTAEFSATSTSVKEFVAFSGSSFPTPIDFGSVSNQSIQSAVSIDGLIITHPNFLAEAQRLANYRSSNDGLDVAVVTTTQVYNEFSSGAQDVTALRDFAKYVYENGGRLKYLLLFGDASFDYKYRTSVQTNFVPIYQSRDSFSPIYSHSSDDYFGFFEDAEGEWTETSLGDHTMEIGVGRIPAKTLKEAKTAVDKIIRYSSSVHALGRWRNEVTYIVDDGDINVHVQQAEDLVNIIDESNFNSKKLYLDAFEQVINPQNERSPALNRAIRESIESGSLFVNYLGHGNETVWMDERVLSIADIEEMTNFQRLPIFVTATCEFGRYDDPFQFSGAEQLLLLNQGAIALLTTTRPVFAHTNFVLNQAYHESILAAGPGKDLRLGDIIRETKNNGLQGPVNRNFALLGDPMIRPAYPRFEIKLDQFAGEEPDTLSALGLHTVSGQIMDDGNVKNDFNGTIEIVLFDIPVEKTTLGQQSDPFPFTERDNVLFRGTASVTNGEFSHQFILPKNISYKNEPGKLSLYAWDEDITTDAGGVSNHLIIGGTASNFTADNTAPDLDVYLNEPGFINGSTVGSGAMLIAEFSDESGINISNLGLDRGIRLELNGEIIELNDFYTAALDDFTQGTVLYPLKDLEPGRYTALIKASDTHNNPVQASVDFVVSDQPIIQTYNFKAFPNPARDFANFSFEHDREGEPLVIELVIYSLNGDKAYVAQNNLDFSLRNEKIVFTWGSNRLRDGMYAYKLQIRSLADGATKELFGRLVIRN